MRILVTNDDGVNARGIALLEQVALRLADEVWVVAPAEEQSGTGHSLTLTRPLRVRRLGERRHAVLGTPTDSVMMALALLMKDSPPDLILSGINRGANLGEDVTYSGTVSAAMEGALAGIPAIALSQVYARQGMGDSVSFDAAEAWAERVLRPLVERPPAPGTLVNVNFPALPASAVRGVRVVPQGLRDYGRLKVEQRTDPRGFPYFWFAFGQMPHKGTGETDLSVTADGWISVTPLHLNLTHGPSMQAWDGAWD
ncbi:5'/3'-nucleotidase SurE [Sphingomonas jatrophae]|uniref:5'-nucleotidase SurE n=1 Tax=Sphingomonas jatrophae TaxID=1166337 RepID=A0A1I6JHX7_9SPHN|nr:5'/3'-nucleotidase SurE [Sphingomonas jatrophae]SFR78555.1 5'-nucleotidase /3'-nucleotidase /exopolyphosphatase [Sphingomonas jatrophae]